MLQSTAKMKRINEYIVYNAEHKKKISNPSGKYYKFKIMLISTVSRYGDAELLQARAASNGFFMPRVWTGIF